MSERKSRGSSANSQDEAPQGAWSETAVRVLRERYLKKDELGQLIETPDEMCWRVAHAIASAEATNSHKSPEEIAAVAAGYADLMLSRRFMPNSPTLMNAGKGNNLQLSACFVIPVEDSLAGIFESVKHAAMVHQSGGGTGFSFSRLRPEGSVVSSTHGVASGPVSFMRIFDQATESVKQGGCVVPETRVSTALGMVQVGTLGPTEAAPQSWHALPHPVHVANDTGGNKAEEFYFNGLAAVRRLRTTNGYSFTGTLEHRIRVIDQQGMYAWKHLSEIQVGDWVALQKNTYPDSTDYRFPAADRVPHFTVTTSDPHLPEVVFQAGAVFARRVLRDLFTFDGSLAPDGYPSLHSASRGLIEDTQQLLLALGIPSSISVMTDREDALGKNPTYRLRVITRAGLHEFAKQIAFMPPANNALWDDHLEIGDETRPSLTSLPAKLTNNQFYDQIATIEEDEAVTVDLSVAETHTYIANGFVSHNSRRGANMGILRVDHPDIEKFIESKMSGGITNFNISVAITDTFMDALEHDAEYDLVDPHTKQVTGRKRARELFDKIVHAAWATGDPGLVFLDRANHSTANPIPEIEQLEATNPCVVGETLLATDKGLQRMDALYASQEAIKVATDARVPGQFVDAALVNGEPLTETRGVIFHDAVPVFRTDVGVPVRKLITSHGIEITATPNHRFLTTQGYKRMDRLEFGDELLLQSDEGAWSQDRSLPEVVYGLRSESRLKAKIARGEVNPPTEWSQELGEVLGYVLGDGYVRRSDTCDVVGVAISLDDTDIKDAIQQRFKTWFGVAGGVTERQGHYQVQYEGTVATFLWGLGLTTARAHEKRVPTTIFTAPREAVIGFLRGLFTADGSVQIGKTNGSCSVRLATSSKDLAADVQQLLLNFGIVSSVKLRRDEAMRLMPNAQRELAEYISHAQYELFLDKANRDRFAELIGFMQERKQQKLVNWIAAKKQGSLAEKFTTKVAIIEDAGEADVYDTTVDVAHSVIINGIITSNCGEQYLGPYDACNLGSINLGLFVQEGHVDWEGLEATTRECTRFLDDVIDVNPYPLQEIRDKVQANRRIGLGVMGWADMLFELGIRYDSEEAIQLGERVMVAVRDWSSDESIKMAAERGEFANWSRSIYKNEAPRRNSTCTTVAPTGSISIIADCSSGIEPIFALAFQHRVKQPDGGYRVLDFINPLFTKAVEASDYPDKVGVLAWVREHGTLHGHPAAEHPDLMPFVTAHEIAPEWHIRMQAAFQKGVHNSISKTINLPHSATYEDVEQAYLQAWELGCLGITIFRDGSKGEQVLNVGVKTEAPKAEAVAAQVQPAPAPIAAPAPEPIPAPAVMASAAPGSGKGKVKRDYTNGVKNRPEVVQGYTRRVRSPEGSVNVTLNSDSDGLLEVFVAIGKAGSDVAALAEALGRLISLQLRIESPLSQNDRARAIAEQLKAIGGSASIGFGMDRVRSLPDAVAKAIMLHLESAGTDPVAPAGEGAGLSPSQAKPPTFTPAQAFTAIGNLCPQCGCNTLIYAEGCKKCMSCGYSEC